MSKFDRSAVKRVTISSLDTTGPAKTEELTVTAHYNPKELEISRSVPWQKPAEANKSNAKDDGGIHLEFTGAEGRTMSLELLFDAELQETGHEAVVESVKTLERLATVRDPRNSKEEFKRPYHCQVVWGELDFGNDKSTKAFNGVIESLSTKYTMFANNGLPLRATCVVKFKEAKFLKTAKKK